jgi:hypothetical protein
MAELFFGVCLLLFASWVGVRLRRREVRQHRRRIGEEAFDSSLGTASDRKAWTTGVRGIRGSFIVAEVRRVHRGGFFSWGTGDEYAFIDEAGNQHPSDDVVFKTGSHSHLRSHVGKEAFDRSLGDEAEEAAFLAGNRGPTFFTIARVRRDGDGHHVLVDTAGNEHNVGNTLVRPKAQPSDVICPRCNRSERGESGWCSSCIDELRGEQPDATSVAVSLVVALPDALNRRDFRAAEALFTSGYICHVVKTGKSFALRDIMGQRRADVTASPTLTIHYEEAFRDPDDASVIWTRWLATGASNGGREMAHRWVEKIRVTEDQFAESWMYSGWKSLLPVAQTQLHSQSSTTKTCPDCAEEVQAASRICRFCRHSFESDA